MGKKVWIALGIGLLSFGLAAAALAGVEPGAKITHPTSHPYNENPKPSLPANNTAPTKGFLTKEQVLQLVELKPGDEVLSAKLQTWAQHVHENLNDRGKNYEIDPNRMVWVIKVSYPNGIQTKGGFYANAVETDTFDAETGRLLHFMGTGDYKGGGGPWQDPNDKRCDTTWGPCNFND